MDQKQKQTAQKQKGKQQNTNRSSDQFVYDPDYEKHIGKRTGNYYGRVNPKHNFDEFPRFSQYQSHRNTQSSSLAKQSEVRTQQSSHIHNNQRQSLKIENQEPFITKQSPIITAMEPIESNTSSRVPDAPLSGFGEFVISTIKRRTSAIRPSQMKSYRDLLNDLQGDQFKQFIFDEEEIQYITQSAKKQKEKEKERLKQIQRQEKLKMKRLNEQEQQKKKDNKRKKEVRVSFKETIQIRIEENKKEEESNGGGDTVKFYERVQQAVKKIQIPQFDVKMQKIQISSKLKDAFKVKSEDSSQQITNPANAQKLERSPVVEKLEFKPQMIKKASKQEDEDYIYADNYQNVQDNNNQNHQKQQDSSSYSQRQNQQTKLENQQSQSNQIRKSNRKVQANSSQQQSSKKKAEHENKKKANRKPLKGKKQPNRVQRSQTEGGKRGVKLTQHNGTKVRVSSQQLQYIEQLTSETTNKGSNKRYPARTRIKPVQYWQNEKVHYKAGKAVGIGRALLSVKQLLNTNQNYDSIVNINFHSHDIQIELTLPAKKGLESRGFSQPYQYLQIQFQESLKSEQKDPEVYFDDGIRSQRMKYDSVITVQPLSYFQLSNKSTNPIQLRMKMKVNAD